MFLSPQDRKVLINKMQKCEILKYIDKFNYAIFRRNYMQKKYI